MLVANLTFGILLVMAGSLLVGRLGGIGVTAAYAALMAFLWMPPRHSLRVSETQDMLALAFYCAAGVALTRTAPGARKHARDGVGPVRFLQPSPTDLISDPIVHRISGARPVKTEAAFAAAFACSPDQTLEMLAEVLTEGMRPPETHVRPVIVDVRPAPPCRLSLPEHARSALDNRLDREFQIPLEASESADAEGSSAPNRIEEPLG